MNRSSTARRRLLVVLGGVGVVVLVLAGFAATADGADRTPELAGRTFASTATPGHRLVGETQVRLTFEDGHVSATAGCNTLFGGATWTGGVLDAPQLASTMMACSPELTDQDAWLADLLASSPVIALDGDTLVISSTTSSIVLVVTEA